MSEYTDKIMRIFFSKQNGTMKGLMLKRAYVKPWTPREKIAVFDLWDDLQNYGYEVHLVIDINVSFEAIREHIGSLHDAAEWDEIFHTLKESGVNE